MAPTSIPASAPSATDLLNAAPTSPGLTPAPAPGVLPNKPKYVSGIKKGVLGYVREDEADYEVPDSHSMYTETSNLVPMSSTMKGARLMIGSKYYVQAMPLTNPDVPLVDSEDPDDPQHPYSKKIGSRIGLRKAPAAGVVQDVGDDYIDILDPDGKKHTVEMYRHFSHNRKSATHDKPLVKVGDTVQAGQAVAHSNIVDKDGRLALGKNVSVAFMPGRGGKTFEDAITISRSAAQKLSSFHMYGHDIDSTGGREIGRNKYISLFPNKYTNEQIKNITEDGVPKVGSIVNPGDPIFLSVSPRNLSSKDAALGNLSRSLKSSFRDHSETWDKPTQGLVTDVVKTRDGWRVNISTHMPAKVGDKISSRSGSKGVIGDIVPDEQMFKDADGKPMDVLINPASIIGRVNPEGPFEALLGKIAQKTGKPYYVPHFSKDSYLDFVESELKKHNMSDTEDLHDPVTNKKVKGVMTGVQHFFKLEHVATDKISGRGSSDEEGSTIDEQAGAGSKRVANLMLNALLSHGATANIRDIKTYRGSKNEDLWRKIKLGEDLPAPKIPFVFDKFRASLQAAGVNVEQKGSKIRIHAMTERDLDRMNPKEVLSSDTLNAKTGDPIKGGMFDPGTFGGPEGKGWGYISLPHPIPNPIMEDPVRTMLGLTKEKFEQAVSGELPIGGGRGPEALAKAVKEIDLTKLEENARNEIRNGRKSKRDDAVKMLRFVTGMKKAGMSPEDLLIKRVPVLPPAYRPISMSENMNIVADPNYLYKDLFNAKESYLKNKGELPEEDLRDETLSVYKAVRAIQGLDDPITPESQEKGVKGFIRAIVGTGGPKTGYFMSKVVGSPVDTVGRSVLTPDAKLDMDQVGVPEKMAWKMFSPFVMRRMVKNGVQASYAAKEIEKKSDFAKKYLMEELKHRPVLYTRDPALHRFNIMGGYAQLRDNDSIAISPLVNKGFNADHDGNCIVGASKLFVKIPLKSDIFSATFHLNNGKVEKKMPTTQDTKIITKLISKDNSEEIHEIQIKDMPRVLGSQIKDKNGADVYSVPKGIKVLTGTTDGEGARWSPITQFTVEEGCSLVKISTSRGKTVTASDNESIAIYGVGGRIGRIKTAESVGHMVPIVHRIPTTGDRYNADFGWLVGAFVSDGWTSDNMLGYTKVSAEHRLKFVRILSNACGKETVFKHYESVHHSQTNSGIGGMSSKIHINKTTDTAFIFDYLERECYSTDVEGKPAEMRSCLFKRLPRDLASYSREALLGLLAGLLDGDGSIAINDSKQRSSRQVVVNFATSSPYLKEDVMLLCRLLGIAVSCSTYLPRPGAVQRYPSHTITISCSDLQPIAAELPVFKSAAMDLLIASKDMKNDLDIVPIEYGMLELITGTKVAHLFPEGVVNARTLNTLKSDSKKLGYIGITRKIAEKILKNYCGNQDLACVKAFAAVTSDKTIRWEKVSSAESVPTETVYDICVPDTKVFALSSGLIVYDSMNIHVPVSDEAVQEVKEKMLPSQNLLSIKERKAHYLPSQEFILGLYNSTAPNKKKYPAVFSSKEEMLAALKRQEIDIDTPVHIVSGASDLLKPKS